MTTVYTDGACIPNPGPGGWAWAVPGGPYASGFDPRSTNQRMEVTAALEAVTANRGSPLRVISDSKYVVDCFTNRWYERWEQNGWRSANDTPVANQDLWRPLIELHRKRTIRFEWVKGHSNDPMNNVVDRLANNAARTQSADRGSEPSTVLSDGDTRPPPRVQAGGSAVSRLPGWRVVTVGLRPPKLGGYDPTNPLASRLTDKLAEILAGLCVVHPDILVLTGLDLGAQQLGAEAALRASVPYAVVLAYPEPERVWPTVAQQRYRQLLAGATSASTLANKPPRSKPEAGMASDRRDQTLFAAAHAALVVWDQQDRRVGDAVTALQRRIPDDVWIVAPE